MAISWFMKNEMLVNLSDVQAIIIYRSKKLNALYNLNIIKSTSSVSVSVFLTILMSS